MGTVGGGLLALLLLGWLGLAAPTPPALAACAPGAAHPGTLVVNGSFETPCDGALTHGTWGTFTSIPGWIPVAVPAPQVQFCPPVIELDTAPALGGLAPADGKQSAELNANCPSGLEQTLTTVPGTTYLLRFAFAARPGTSPSANILTVSWGGSPVATLGPTSTASYAYHTYAVTAAHAATTLDFYSGTPTTTSVGTELDDVSVVGFAPGGGAFVVGDQSATGSVTFWGAHWGKANALSGGAAPAAFKGFADRPVGVCGTTWSTAPGASSAPPSGPLPPYLAVVVSSAVSKSGPTIAGTTAHIVVVQTNPGYGPDPGQAGTGTVVGAIC
jgi:hypothetical protein